jgi:hypothetical protein
VQLELGQVTETVNVNEEEAAINTQIATIGSRFTEVQVRQLPLQTRNVVELLALQPGVTATGQVIGAKAANGFLAVLPIPLDSVQEFRTTVARRAGCSSSLASGRFRH